STNSIAIPLDSGYYPTSIEPEDWVWSNIEIVSSESTSISSSANIAVDLNDNIHVVWVDNTDYNGAGTDFDIFYKKFDRSTSTWGSAVVISSESTSGSFSPNMVVDNQNNIHIVWHDYTDYDGSGGDGDIFYKKYDYSTSTWGTTVIVSTESGDASQIPVIDIDSNGNLHVVWSDYTDYNGVGTDIDIFYKKYDSSTNTWGDSIVLSIDSTSDSESPSLKIDGKNNVHVVWSDYTGIYGIANTHIVYRKYDTITSNWNPIEVIWTPSSATNNALHPKLAIDNLDNLHVAWVDNSPILSSGNDYDVLYRKYISTYSMWGAISVLSTDSDTYISGVTLGVDKFNNLYCAWMDDYVASTNNIKYRIFNFETGAWSQRKYIAFDSRYTSGSPSISFDSLGFAHVVWSDKYNTETAGTDYDIYYRSYSGLPTRTDLNTINPNPTDDSVGITWDPSLGASTYNIYRSTDPIYDLTGLSPHATTESLYYVDHFDESGFFYYVITGVNYLGEGEMSNMEYVEVNLVILNNLQNSSEITSDPANFPTLWIVTIFISAMVIRNRNKRS
ncbi:MAG: hypothetical protein OEZ01_03310, partial [Candidatus Heimdallarchaeota archaeon]|nr:hypothetical protein [Candidatus Heimdallarchaeota archaeon]